jgi:DNA mismatch endonuclease (patch repair protein)
MEPFAGSSLVMGDFALPEGNAFTPHRLAEPPGSPSPNGEPFAAGPRVGRILLFRHPSRRLRRIHWDSTLVVGARPNYLTSMVDNLTREARSERMSRIRGKDTVPELFVRRLVHGLGYRFRLHRKGLPGSPDLTFAGRKKIIFVHGCYWHGHHCKWGRLPKSNVDFWHDKIVKNRARDSRNLTDLEATGWSVLVIWQCETKDAAALQKMLKRFLGRAKKKAGRTPQRIK